MLFTAISLVVSVLGYGAYIAKQQTDLARQTITAQMTALAQNLATVNAYFLLAHDLASIEAIAIQTATVPGIFSVLVADTAGLPLSEVVNKNGQWSPRFSAQKLQVPKAWAPLTVHEAQTADAARRDFLAGTQGTMTAWHPVGTDRPLGWVRVSYRLDSFDQTARDIWTQAILVILLAIVGSLFLLTRLLKHPMRDLREATHFAAELHQTLGTRISIATSAAEIQALDNALNVVSARLFTQNNDLNNQKFALDQHAIVSITDLNGTITYANERFCEISGYARSELIGQNHRIVKSGFHPPEVFTELWHCISQGRVWRAEVKNRKKNGEHYWVAATIVPLMGADGLPQQYIGIRTDITANKNLELSLQNAKEEAEAATVAKGQFLANMSHEIRTPMNAILGMLRLLQGTELSDRQLDYVSKTEGAAKSLLSLLNDILDFSKMDAGKMSLDPQAFGLDQLMRELSVILSANVGNKPVEVLFDIDPQVPKALVGDAMRLQQVLINLGGNAIKFTEHGEVLIEIRLLAQDAQQVSLRFSVRDSGIGIAPQNQQHIFDGFSQAEASTTRRFGGTGLGLPISKQLVALMGGELSLQSTLGQGSNFSFCISLGRASLSGEDPLASQQPSQEPLDVLVIDDNDLARSVMVSMARSWGWQVQAVGSGQEALDLVQARMQAGQALYQVVFVDWHMPGLDGWQTMQQLQQMMGPAHKPIIVMVTAQGREMLSQRTAQEQASLHSFLVKPITASMLFDTVANARAGRSNLRAAPRQKTHSKLRLQGLRLLVVEDNIVNQQVAQELLSAEGAHIELAANGELGVAAVAAAQPPFDAVLMDIQMPVMDGYSATRAIRQELGLTQLPIIAMTANAMASDREACLAAGMNDHVGKPFDLPHLIKVLHQQLRHNASASASASAPVPVPASEAASPVAPRNNSRESELPDEDALDVPGALERLGGNAPLYARILQSYLQEIALMPEQLKALLLAHDLAAATRLMHTLKGLSATVGASYLAALAKAAEGALKAQPALSQEAIESMWQGLRQGVASTTHRLAALALELTEPASSAAHAAMPGAPELSALLPQLQQLRDLLLNSDMGALALFERLQQPLTQLNPELLTPLHNAISALDFKLAVAQCDKFVRSLQNPQ
jgi:PAS domain S-box-containing protein